MMPVFAATGQAVLLVDPDPSWTLLLCKIHTKLRAASGEGALAALYFAAARLVLASGHQRFSSLVHTHQSIRDPVIHGDVEKCEMVRHCAAQN